MYILLFALCYLTSSFINKSYAYNTYSVADNVCNNTYGEACVRVHNTSEFKSKLDNLFNNKMMGTFYFVWDTTESVNFKEGYNYFFNKYGVPNSTNQYPYSKKGDFEPYRNKLSDTYINEIQQIGNWELDTKSYIRISKEEKEYANEFVDRLLPLITAGATSDYEKAYRVGKYINSTTRYKGDQVYQNDNGFVYTDTSIYDVFIERDSVCIGFSIAFAYMMDKLGIEAYVIDSSSSNGNEFQSVHSYNKVKIGGTMYTVDITGGTSFGFNTSGLTNYSNTNQIDNLYNQYRGGISLNYKFYSPKAGSNAPIDDINTTTTVPAYKPTTTKEEPNTYKVNTTEETTTTTSIVQITNEAGEVVETSVIYPTTNPTTQEEVKGEEEVKKHLSTKTVLNIVLITIAVVMVILLIYLKLKDLGKIKCDMKDL
jgi:transglutaminase-like putative cysteine protease